MNNLEQSHCSKLCSEKYVSIDWNNANIYEKMLKELFKEYEKNKES